MRCLLGNPVLRFIPVFPPRRLLAQGRKTIVGRVVAYSISPTCLNENGYWALIIRVQPPEDVRSKFVRVDFTFPCKAKPAWLYAVPSIQRFDLFREKDCGAVLVGANGSGTQTKI